MRLETEPAGRVEAGVLLRVRGVLVPDLDRCARSHRHQLGLARPLHRDEPERGLVDGLADGEQAVVLVDGGLAVGELRGELAAGFDVEHDGTTLLGDDVVILVEDAGVLGERRQRDAERAERLAVRRVRMRSGDHVGAGGMDGCVDDERGSVDRLGAVDDVAVVVDEDQVALLDVAEAHAERVHPEHVGILGVAYRDVSGDAFGEPEPSERAQRPGEVGLAVVALVLDVVELRDAVEPDDLGGQFDPVDRCRVRWWRVRWWPCSVMAMVARLLPHPPSGVRQRTGSITRAGATMTHGDPP